MLESQLSYLEKCTPPRNYFWKCYLQDRVPAIQAEIDRLRRFANRRAGKVADNVNAKADALQARLDTCKVTL
jgi:hypothetical protein